MADVYPYSWQQSILQPTYTYTNTTTAYAGITNTLNLNHVAPAPMPPRTALDRLDDAVEATCAKARKAIG